MPIEEAITSLSHSLFDPAQSQATARSTTDNAPAQINANPTKQGQLVSGVAVVDCPAKALSIQMLSWDPLCVLPMSVNLGSN